MPTVTTKAVSIGDGTNNQAVLRSCTAGPHPSPLDNGVAPDYPLLPRQGFPDSVSGKGRRPKPRAALGPQARRARHNRAQSPGTPRRGSAVPREWGVACQKAAKPAYGTGSRTPGPAGARDGPKEDLPEGVARTCGKAPNP